jgi:LysM repeat protein
MYVRKLLFALVAAMLVAGQLFSPAFAQSTCGDTYTVKGGDNLSKIAAACNVTVADLLKANPEIKDPNLIRSGQVLRLKPSAATPTTNPTSPTSTPAPANAGEYVVQRGDTLSKIATRFGTTVQAILSVNPKITNPAMIYVGQVIKLPSGVADRNVRLTLSTTSPKVNGQVEVKVTGFPANASIDYQVGIEGRQFDPDVQLLELFVRGGEGASAIMSRAAWFLGKAITSRMLGSSASSITRRSMPGAMPPCGGAPYSNASSRWPNLAWISSSFSPSSWKILKLNIAAVDTDGAGGHLVAVADHVVGVRKDIAGVGVEFCQVFHLGHGEGMVGGVPALFFLVPLEHGEVDHPGKGHQVFVGQVEPVAEQHAQRAEGLVGHGFWSATNRIRSPSLAPVRSLQRADFFGGDELLGGALHAFGGQRQGGQALRALFFGKGWSGRRPLCGCIRRSRARPCT